jgi:N-acetylmuramoyl-L-alanine amidase
MFKLALNAGHGKNTAGKRCMKSLDKNETREWVLNSRICEKIEKKLKTYTGYEIIRLDDVTGEKDTALKNRVNSANKFGADFYLSVHHNAGIKGGNGGGIETYVHTNASNKSIQWQKELYEALIKHTSLKGNRSNGKRKSDLYECRESKMPCVLIECGYMDSKTDVSVILTDDFAEKVADACAEVIVKHGKLKKKIEQDPLILYWQKAAIKDGFQFSKNHSGNWDKECETVAKKAVCKKRVKYKYKNLTKFVQEAVNVTVDGKFGYRTQSAVMAFQLLNNLTPDGCVGIKTWKKILGVK